MRLTLLSREHCHLCEDMAEKLRPWTESGRFVLETLDIDTHPALLGRYDEWVPVLLCGTHEICHYFLDEAALRDFLGNCPESG